MATARLVGPCILLMVGCTEYPDEGTVVKPGTGVATVP